MSISILKINHSNYPDLLKTIHKPPAYLFYKGNVNLLNQTCIAIVGTRKYSEYGEYATQKIIEELSLYDIAIVSGLAKGIDTIAHRSSLKNAIPTIAVLGSGIDNIYPKENQKLSEQIIQRGGLIISEHPDKTSPTRKSFPRRNRIISGISVGTVVIEAPDKSGALLTSNFAIEQNREVFTIPGDIDRINSVGPLNLLKRSAAHPISSGHEIMETLTLQPKLPAIISLQEEIPALSPTENLIMGTLSKTRGRPIDNILKQTNLPLQNILSTLSLLEIKNLIKIRDGNYFRKC